MLSPHDGDFPGVIMRFPILLIGFDVLFVQNDESDIRKRREDGTSSAYHHSGFAAGDAAVFIIFLRRGQFTMEDCYVILEAAREILDHPRGKGDFGDKHQNVLSAFQILFGKMQIDFRLAGPCNPLKQIDFFIGIQDGFIGLQLLEIQCMGFLFFIILDMKTPLFLLDDADALLI